MMTKEEALRLALYTLNEVGDEAFRLLKNSERLYSEMKVLDTIYEIKETLKTKDEPVGWIDSKGYMICAKTDESCRPLYTTPQTKEWVGLTKEDADNIECWFREEIENDRFSVENLIAHIEAKLKERNT